MESRFFAKHVGEADLQPAVFSLEAKIAINLVERWGAVAGKHDGEDSSGRAKLGLQSPEELVDRAVSVAKLIVDRLDKERLMRPVTDVDIAKSNDRWDWLANLRKKKSG